MPPNYFPSGFQLFPAWPAQDPEKAVTVFVGTMLVLMAPKLFALLALPFERRRAGFGAAAPLGLLLETVVSGLLAPVMMVVQSLGILDILRGRDGGWNAQRRDDGSLPLGALLRLYGKVTVLGLVFAAAAWAIAWPLFFWMLPVVLGPPPRGAARRRPRAAAPRAGPRRLPACSRPRRNAPRHRSPSGCTPSSPARAAEPDADPVARLLADAEFRAAHLAMLPEAGRRRRGDVDPARLVARAKLEDATSLDEARKTLSPRELAAALGDDRSIARLTELADGGTSA